MNEVVKLQPETSLLPVKATDELRRKAVELCKIADLVERVLEDHRLFELGAVCYFRPDNLAELPSHTSNTIALVQAGMQECRDAIQWIVQVREGKRWVGTSYCRNCDVLIERSGAKGDALAILRALPEMHP